MISELFELFDNIKVYGYYIRLNKLDGLEYWNKIKDFILKPEQLNGVCLLNNILKMDWNINFIIDTESTKSTKDKNVIYNFVHENLKVYGEDSDKEKYNIDNNIWEKYNYILQLIKIPKNEELNLLTLLQIGYNIGQLSFELLQDKEKVVYTKNIINFFVNNKLDDINSYIIFSDEFNNQINSNNEITNLLENLNKFIQFTFNEIQKGVNINIDDIFTPFYNVNIEKLTEENTNYRNVIYTGYNQQFVLMSIKPNDDIKMEVHNNHDQFIKIVSGEGKANIGITNYELKKDTALIVPAGCNHQIINTSSTDLLKLYTIYSPPEHNKNLIQIENPDNINLINDNLNTDEFIQKIKNEDEINVKPNDDDKYKSKYLKYKNKYIQLKNL